MKKLICSFLVGFVILATAGLAGAITITFDDIGAGTYYSDLIIYDGSMNQLGTISTDNDYLQIADYNSDGNLELASKIGPAHALVSFDVDVISFSVGVRSQTGAYTETPTYSGSYIASMELSDSTWTTFWDNLTFSYVGEENGGDDGGDDGGDNGDDSGTGGTGTGNPAPEPATMLLLGVGLVGLAGVRRTFKK